MFLRLSLFFLLVSFWASTTYASGVKPPYTQKQIAECLNKNTHTIKSAHPRKVLFPRLKQILTGLIGKPRTQKARYKIKYLAAAMTTAIYFSLVGRKWSKFRRLEKKPFEQRVLELKRSAARTKRPGGLAAYGTDTSKRLSFTGVYRLVSPSYNKTKWMDFAIHKASEFNMNRLAGFSKAFTAPVGPKHMCQVYTHIYVNRKLPLRIHLLMTVMHRGYVIRIKLRKQIYKFFVFRSLEKREITQAFRNKGFVRRLKKMFRNQINLTQHQKIAQNFLREYAVRHSGFIMVGRGLILLNQTGIAKRRFMGFSMNYIANSNMLRGYTLRTAKATLNTLVRLSRKNIRLK